MLQKQFPVSIPESIEELKHHNEAFLLELQRQLTGKMKSSPPVSQAASLIGSPMLPIFPYMQHPYPHMSGESTTPWNVGQQFPSENDIAPKKSQSSDGPLNLSKPKSSGDYHKNSMKSMSNDGNNNSKNHSHSIDHLAAGSKILPNVIPRHPFNIPFNGDEADLFRLWPMMAAAAQNHPANSANNLPNLMAANHRDLISENAFSNFAQNLNDVKNKRSNDSAGMSPTNMNDEKIRMVRQQSRGRSSNSEAMGKQ
jgi:hypothetical protein